MIEQFLVVAGAHFLALLSPGADFFLIVRGALVAGWRRASGICLGIALANGLFIALAIGGFAALRPDGTLFKVVQGLGCLYLAWLGWRFLRAPPAAPTLPALGQADASAQVPLSWGRGLFMGLASGLLNPKNALFYASLFAALASSRPSLPVQVAYGVWMFSAVLVWDVLVAAAIGHPAVVARFARRLPAIERATGVLMLALAAGVAWALWRS